MHKVINGPMMSSPWPGTSVPNIHDPRHLQFTGGVSRGAQPIENGLNGGPHYAGGANRPTQRPPNVTSPLFDDSDPAFSSDPYQHPDHAYEGPSLNNGLGKGGSVSGPLSEDADFEPPPAYDDNSPISTEFLARPQAQYESTSSLSTGFADNEQGSSSNLRSLAQSAYDNGGFTLTPHSSTSNLSASQYSTHDEREDQEEELLGYLQDHDGETAEVPPVQERDIPMSLRPHMGLPVTSQMPTDSQERGRQGAESSGLQRSATLAPVATRTVSEPLAATIVRPRLPRRGNTTSPGRVSDLDRIDELDETTPLGLPIHHRGPYEMQENMDAPPARVLPLDREQQYNPRQRVIVATTSPSAPPAPVPFKLNLKPGELLTRVPPSGSRTRPPEPYPPYAANQSSYQRAQTLAPDGVSSRFAHPNNGYNEWSPEQLYEDPSFIPQPTIPRNLPGQLYHANMRETSPVSSANTSRSDLRSNAGSNSDLDAIPTRPLRQKRVAFQQSQQQSPLSQPSSQSTYPPSSAASAYSASSSSLSRPPPSSADRHRPKKIVMPAPLQPQNQNFMQPVPRELNRKMGTTGVPAQSTAAVIPVHESKRGNLLKKRTITGSTSRQVPTHELPQRAQSMKGLFSLGGSSGSDHVREPEAKLPKTSRKLSKRKTAS